MTPRLDDLRNIENVDSVNVEVADGFTVPVNAIGECRLHLEDQNVNPFTVIMKKVLYVPGLTQRLLSIPTFSNYGNSVNIRKVFITLSFRGRKVRCLMVKNQKPFFSAVPAHTKKVAVTSHPQDSCTPIPIELLHQRLGHTKTNTLLYT